MLPLKANASLKNADRFLGLAGLPVLLLCYLGAAIAFGILPAEDAAILFLYSENLVDTGAITYSPNGPIEEGATDFLWMLLLAGFYGLGFDTYKAALLLNGAAATTVFLVLSGYRKNISGVALLLFSIAYFTADGALSSLAGFATSFFLGAIILTVYCLLARQTGYFLLLSTLTALTRPEGFFISGYLVAFYWLVYAENKHRFFLQALAGFALPCLLYWGWRTWYFDNLIPLPLQVKAGHGSSFAYLFDSLKYYLFALLGAVAASAWLRDRTFREAGLFLGLFLTFLMLYGSSMLSQNIYQRFLFFGPMTSLCALFLLCNNTQQPWLKRYAIICMLLLVVLQIHKQQYVHNFSHALRDTENSATSIAKEVATQRLAGKALVTEAGRFPYYSRWLTSDSWGLNSKAFTRKLIEPEEVEQGNFDLILLHPQAPGDRIDQSTQKHQCLRWRHNENSERQTEKNWSNMVSNMLLGIRAENYHFLLVPYNRTNNPQGTGDDGRYDCYFIRKDYPQADQLISIIRNHGDIDYSSW